MSPITQDEAKEALADIDQAAQQTRRIAAAGPMGNILLLWGIIWFLGFFLSYLYPPKVGPIWWCLSALGMGVTALLVYLDHRRGMVLSAQNRKLLGQLSLSWLVVFAYAMTLVFALHPGNGVDELTLIICLFMMGYVLMGIWLKSPLLLGIGLLITAATLTGRAIFSPNHFMLWMAFFGGGGLFVPGLYVKLRWK